MSRKDPAFEKSRSIEDLQHLRLTALLGEMVRDKGIMRAAQECQVHWRWKALVDTQRVLEKREILRWLRRALSLGMWRR